MSEGGYPTALCDVMSDLANFTEVKFSTPVSITGARGIRGSAGPLSGLVNWESMNVNSIYGREKQICKAMFRYKIAFLAVQEPMLRPGRLPQGLFKTVFAKFGADGRRGLMWIVHPDFAHCAHLIAQLGDLFSHPNYLRCDGDGRSTPSGRPRAT